VGVARDSRNFSGHPL